MKKKSSTVVDKFIDYVIKGVHNLEQCAAVNVTTSADAIGVSRCHLSRQFRARAGETPEQYINRMKMIVAGRLLIESHMAVHEVTLKTGFCRSDYFIVVFKKHFGTTPGRYREIHRRAVTR